jgi:hypothetical protein
MRKVLSKLYRWLLRTGATLSLVGLICTAVLGYDNKIPFHMEYRRISGSEQWRREQWHFGIEVGFGHVSLFSMTTGATDWQSLDMSGRAGHTLLVIGDSQLFVGRDYTRYFFVTGKHPTERSGLFAVVRDRTLFYDDVSVSAPAWLVALLLAVLPVVAAARVVRHLKVRVMERRVQRGLCAACGYDLRASTDRCPECGTLVATQVRALPEIAVNAEGEASTR